MIKQIKRTLVIIIISLPFIFWLIDIYHDRQNLIIVEDSTLLFATHEEASLQDCINCSPVKEIKKIEKNEKLKVKRTIYGKDYWALKVETETGETGWVIAGQKGIKIKQKI